ncbi:MAG: UMP kinase [Deltaproteobacteria bacterium]|nr:UMP kinase [Deltaproteobacteria bacterium]MDD9827736.1 UMP kinase [Deltaproteobacteria bacterium]MDD9853188.1 UMP kinase [Deltaproteobacteria bacterium]MDD9872506.1 UMP kinase [Deltaproteobacteria bacterium]
MSAAYRRILLKLSGELLAGDSPGGIQPAAFRAIAEEIAGVLELGVQIGIVIGGGNIIRGMEGAARGMDRTTADYLGMLASVMNAMALQDALEKRGVNTRVLSALSIRKVAEPQIRRRALRHLEKGRLLIFAGGTGEPYFSTDTAAALRAAEIGAEAVFKATRVDGVYSADPERDPGAQRYERLSFDEAIQRSLRFMDQAAIALCRENALPIVVFNAALPGNIRKALLGERVGTTVGG